MCHHSVIRLCRFCDHGLSPVALDSHRFAIRSVARGDRFCAIVSRFRRKWGSIRIGVIFLRFVRSWAGMIFCAIVLRFSRSEWASSHQLRSSDILKPWPSVHGIDFQRNPNHEVMALTERYSGRHSHSSHLLLGSTDLSDL